MIRHKMPVRKLNFARHVSTRRLICLKASIVLFSLCCLHVYPGEIEDEVRQYLIDAPQKYFSDDLRKHLLELIEQAENTEKMSDPGEFMALLARKMGSVHFPKSKQNLIIALCDRALKHELSSCSKMAVLKHKASALHIKYSHTKDAEMVARRREVVEPMLLALREALDFESAFKNDYFEELPDMISLDRIDRIGKEKALKWRRQSQALRESRDMKAGMENYLVDLHSRGQMDLSHLKARATEILGDETLAENLVNQVKKRVTYHIEQDSKRLLEDILEKDVALVKRSERRQLNPKTKFPSSPGLTKTDAASPKTAQKTASTADFRLLLAVIIAIALLTCAGVYYATRIKRKHNP